MKFLERLKNGLLKTKSSVMKQIDQVFSAFVRVDEDLFDELEEHLIESDVGVETTMEILDRLRRTLKEQRITDPVAAKAALLSILADMIGEGESLNLGDGLTVILMIGVNGVGKTTSIAKIANYLKNTEEKKCFFLSFCRHIIHID